MQQASRQSIFLLLCRVEKCETQSYANESESGETRVAGSNSGGGGHAPFFIMIEFANATYSCWLGALVR
jgi:hypothetical protein